MQRTVSSARVAAVQVPGHFRLVLAQVLCFEGDPLAREQAGASFEG